MTKPFVDRRDLLFVSADVNARIISVRLWRHSSVGLLVMIDPDESESFPARTRLYSAGTTRRFVRSPPAPKMAGLPAVPDFATVQAASATSSSLQALPDLMTFREWS